MGILKWYRKKVEREVRQELFEKQSFSDWKANCEQAFIDSNGVAYYRYLDEGMLPLARLREMQVKALEIKNRISLPDQQAFLTKCKAIGTGKESAEAKLEKLMKMVFLLDDRVELAIPPPDLLMDMVCIMYIAEDQDPSVFHVEHEKKKFDQLMKDKNGGLADFFSQAGINQFLPSFKDGLTVTDEYLMNADLIARRFRELTQAV